MVETSVAATNWQIILLWAGTNKMKNINFFIRVQKMLTYWEWELQVRDHIKLLRGSVMIMYNRQLKLLEGQQ